MRRAHVLFVGGGDRGAVLRTLLPAARFDVERADRYEIGLERLIDSSPDVCLVDYHLDDRTALDFLRESRRLGSKVPIVFLAGPGEVAVDHESIEPWGADWIDVTDLNAALLERTIRYALERRRFTQALRTSETRYRLLFERNLAGLAISTEDGQILECNRAFARVFGYDAQADARAAMVLAPPVRSALLVSGLLTNAEFRLTRRDGSPMWVLVNATLAEADERPRLIEASFVDISHRRRAEDAEAQLRQAQKMEAIGRLAGGVAHDFNNLLTAILGHIEMLPDDVMGNERVRPEIDGIRRAAERAASLTGQLLAFSRRQLLQPRALDLNEVVADVEKLLRRLIGEDIELVLDLKSGLKPVTADRSQLEQAIVNLAVNARDAMPDGGRLTIETGNAPGEADEPGDDRFVMVTVSDTGIGMDEETLAHIYEPFFTTKGTRGTGLGLAMVYGFVQQSGGRVTVRSQPGQGATFRLYLPESANPPHKAAPEPAPASAAGGAETILVVEDEASVRSLVCRVLLRRGYTVLEASDPRQATSIVEEHPGPLHLLVTDMVMPHMNGRALAMSLLRLRPQMRVLLMSGYTDPSVIGDAGPAPSDNFLQKPFSPSVLVRTVRAVLDQPRPSDEPAPSGDPRGRH